MKSNQSTIWEKMSALSQLFMLGIVGWGYYNAVRPVVQKERLEEKSAELEEQIDLKEKKISKLDKKLERAKWEYFIKNMEKNVPSVTSFPVDTLQYTPEGKNPDVSWNDIREVWPQPYKELIDKAWEAKRETPDWIQIPVKYVEKFETFVENESAKLDCNEDFIRGYKIKYKHSLNSIEEEGVKPEKVLKKKIRLARKMRGKVYERGRNCADRRREILNSFKKQEGLD